MSSLPPTLEEEELFKVNLPTRRRRKRLQNFAISSIRREGADMARTADMPIDATFLFPDF